MLYISAVKKKCGRRLGKWVFWGFQLERLGKSAMHERCSDHVRT